jgi:hypothetical protein
MLRPCVSSTSALAAAPARLLCRPVDLTTEQRRNVNWQRVVNKWTSKSFTDTWRKLDSDLNSMRFTAKSLPAEVPRIAWDDWRRKIKAPGVVDDIQKKYETKEFPLVKHTYEADDAYISKMEKWYGELREYSRKKVIILEAKIEELHEIKTTRWWWFMPDYFHQQPGLYEYNVMRYSRIRRNTRDPFITRIAWFDWGEARKALKEGRKPENLPPPYLYRGDHNKEEWDKRERAEVAWLERRYKEIMEDLPATAPPPSILLPVEAAPGHETAFKTH